MINFNISTEVPDFFREEYRAKIEKDNKIPSINKFIIGSLDAGLYEKHQMIIDAMLELKIEKALEHLPLLMGVIDHKLYVAKGGYTWEYNTFNASSILTLVDIKLDTVSQLIDLSDGKIYDIDGRQLSTLESPVHKLAVDQFELQELIDWYDNGNIFRKYSKLLELSESAFEMELYGHWIDYHRIKFNQPTDDSLFR